MHSDGSHNSASSNHQFNLLHPTHNSIWRIARWTGFAFLLIILSVYLLDGFAPLIATSTS